MTRWQKDVGERNRIRDAVKGLVERATELDDASKGQLKQALVHVKARRLYLAQNATAELSYAAHQCNDADLRERIEETRRDLDELIF